jgi:UDP-N-acetylmuramyl pentapeptide phosphotransferase/UDP-N-acetylglucosamine-1-phosphate transferase
MSGGDFSALLLGALLPSFVLSSLVGFVVRKRAAKWGLVDQPGGHKSHERVVPLGGGLAIAFGVFITFAIAQQRSMSTACGSRLGRFGQS